MGIEQRQEQPPRAMGRLTRLFVKGRAPDAVGVPPIEFPALVLTDRTRGYSYAYAAANQRELKACSLHTYVRAGRLQGLHFFDAQGRCFSGRATGRWQIDKDFIFEVGPVIWFVAALASCLDVVLLFDMEWQEAPSQSLESVKMEVKDYVRREPKPYTRNRPLQTVLARLTDAATFEQLCRAIES